MNLLFNEVLLVINLWDLFIFESDSCFGKVEMIIDTKLVQE
jgi:hypothetical protein